MALEVRVFVFRLGITITAAAFALSAQDVTPHFEVSGFGGGQFWKLKKDTYPLDWKLSPGFIYGGRAGYDFAPKWGVEGTVSNAYNNEKFDFSPGAGIGQADFGAKNLQFMGGPVYYLKPNTSRLRPFLTGGAGLQYFYPTDSAKATALGFQQFRVGAIKLDDNFTGAFFYGGGFKYWLTRKLNARFDARGIYSFNPHIRYFNQQVDQNPVILPSGGAGHGLQLTGGLGYAIGANGWDSGAAPKTSAMRVKIAGPDQGVYQGDPARFSASAEGPEADKVKYVWRLSDQNIGGGESISIDTSNLPPGAYPIVVLATAPQFGSAKANSTLTILPANSRELKLSLNTPDARVYRGDKAGFSVKAEGPDPSAVAYNWTVNGKQAGSGDSLGIDTRELPAGTYPIEVTGNAQGYKGGAASGVLTVLEPQPALLQLLVPSGDVKYGDKVTLGVNVQHRPGGGELGPVRYSASDGAIVGNQLDTSTVQFDTSTPGTQRKTVNLTASATDSKGLSSRASGAVTVVRTITADATRLPDVVFSLNGSRVNNCGKRVLLEELKAYLDRDPSGQVVLLAHVDGKEIKAVGRRRALNAAAVITAGSGICLGIDPKQVLVGVAGPDDKSEPMPYLCGTSTQEKGRKGRLVRMNDKHAAMRRVEVWFVPRGAKLPPAAAKAKPATAYKVSALGCPK